MKKKEYKKIMKALEEKAFQHVYKSIDEGEVHEETMAVIALTDVWSILRNFKKKGKKKIKITIKR